MNDSLEQLLARVRARKEAKCLAAERRHRTLRRWWKPIDNTREQRFLLDEDYQG